MSIHHDQCSFCGDKRSVYAPEEGLPAICEPCADAAICAFLGYRSAAPIWRRRLKSARAVRERGDKR